MRDDRIDVSVILPTFNRRGLLYASFFMLLKQNPSNVTYEILILDSGNDDTPQLFGKAAKQTHCSVRYIQIQKGCNRSLIRNEGAKNARGELLIFLDNDILVPHDFIEKHFKAHQNSDNLVALNKRKSLTGFYPHKIGYGLISKHFNLFEDLPYYNDVREPFILQKEKLQSIHDNWSFLFSHSFSILKKNFISLGGFNILFGENWGHEDVELGVRAQKSNYEINFIQDLDVYHVPHRSTNASLGSNLKISNSDIFLKLQPFYNIEIYLFYNQKYLELIHILNNVKINVFNHIDKRMFLSYNLILGYLNAIEEEYVDIKKYALGTHQPWHSCNSINKVLILVTFFYFPLEIQTCILAESLRIGKKVYFQYNDLLVCKNKISEIGRLLGYEVRIVESSGMLFIERGKQKESKIFSIVLPTYYEPRQRLMFLLFINELISSNCVVVVDDLFQRKEIGKEDMCLSGNVVSTINKCVGNYFGDLDLRSITSFSLAFKKQTYLPGRTTDYVVDDFAYETLTDSYVIQKKDTCSLLSWDVFEKHLINNLLPYVIKKQVDGKWNGGNKCLCFMESGYYEDGLDSILQTLVMLNDDRMILSIKIPNYDSIESDVFPLHNRISRMKRLSILQEKYENDCLLLVSQIQKLGLNNRIRIIKDNMDIDKIVDLINDNNRIIFANRTIIAPPEFYLSVMLNKDVIIPETTIINNFFKKASISVRVKEDLINSNPEMPINSANVFIKKKSVNVTDLVRIFNEISGYSIDLQSVFFKELSLFCKENIENM